MKKKHLFILAGTLILIGIAYFSFPSKDKQCHYVPRNGKEVIAEKGYRGAMEWLNSRRVDAEGKIDPEKERKAKKEYAALSKLKSSSSINAEWVELGPDNVGGRTRAILYDMNNHNIVYAGGVSGGLWRSTTAGQSWSRADLNILDVDDAPIENLNVSCITQASNGDIYFGTGEYTSIGGLTSLRGEGIWKSTDGITFKKLADTWNEPEDYDIFNFVNYLDSDPNNPNKIYAATRRGLRISHDAGETWVSSGMGLSLDLKVCRDLKVGTDGTLVASVDGKTFISTDNGVSFTNPPGSPNVSSGGRLEYGISPSNPNYIYCQAALGSGYLQGIYRSTDKGQTWITIGPGTSAGFQPMGNQGTYDNCIAVFPDNPEKILIGGQRNMYTFSPENSWELVSDGYFDNIPSLKHLYVHADQHRIVFHPDYNGTTNRTFLVGTDGGVFISEWSGLAFSPRNKNFNVTQFYSIATDGYGHVVGGTQDNGTQINLFNGNSPKNFFEISGGDGGYCAMSNLDPRITFASVYYGNLKRSQEKGRGFDTVGSYFFNNYVLNRYFGGLEDNIGDPGPAAFVTLFKLWERSDDQKSIDSVTYTNVPQQLPIELYQQFEDSIRNTYTNANIDTFHYTNSFGFKYVNIKVIIGAGEKLIARSQIYELPIDFVLPHTLYPEDGIRVKDPYQAMLAMPLRRPTTGEWNIMLTRKPLHFSVAKVDQPWSKLLSDSISSILTGGSNSFVDLEFSSDGEYLYFAFNRVTASPNSQLFGEIYRISGLSDARTRAQLTSDSSSYSLSVKKIWTINNVYLNGISIDPNNPDNMIASIAGFGVGHNIYYSQNATSASPSFATKQGDLPSIPVFDGIINCMDDNQVMIATEFGIFSTDNITAAYPEWTDQNNNTLGPVLTLAITQQTWTNQFSPYIENHGEVYIGTHGRGIFKTDVWKGPVAIQEPGSFAANKKSTFSIFPNPVVDNAQIEFDLRSTENVKLMVFDLQGKMVNEIDMGKYAPGNHSVNVDFSQLNPGTYIVNMLNGNQSNSTKLVVF
ncbi:MAG: T9SS type A sorting domain-containing protein [Bacteroidales bacterium]|nr:T9SS type A sorting domain-containing protein [Bacteroidales bacterium]MCF8455636.1 T9SS type A sorting domain-containing protein [Bacteroidales bacterium]